MNALTLNLPKALRLTDEEFEQLAAANRDLRLERTPTGELIVMPPSGGESSKRNADLTTDLNIWNRQTKLGVVFDSSGGFSLPKGGDRSPDASWVKLERWNALTSEERKRFPPICPDFVIELRSENDNLRELQEKMKEYLANGIRLGWLIDPKTQKVEITRPNQKVEVLQSPTILSGEDVLPGFVLDLQFIFDDKS
jgi:Uma2 family endonuclease